MTGKNLNTLFERYRRDGDPGALAEVFDETAGELLRLARHLMRDEAEAEDLIQATFLAAMEGAARFDERNPLLSWLTGILLNQAKIARRRMARCPDPARLERDRPVDPSAAAERAEFRRELSSALEAVPVRYREVLVRHLDGRRGVEIALDLERPVDTVRTQIHRGLQMLRKVLPPGFLAGSLLVAVEPRGLAAVRQAVVSRAADLAAGGTAAVTGLLVVKKLLLTAALVALIPLAWFLAPDRQSPPAAGRGAPSANGIIAGADRQRVDSAGAGGPEREAVAMDVERSVGPGVVLDHRGGPVAGAEVGVVSTRAQVGDEPLFTCVSDENGHFSLPEGVEGEVFARKQGMGRAYGSGSEIRFGQRPFLKVSGTVRWTNGSPVEGARVEHLDRLAQFLDVPFAITDPCGHFSFPEPVSQDSLCRLRIKRPNLTIARCVSELLAPGAEGEAKPFEYTIGPGVELEVVVEEAESGDPLQSALVVCVLPAAGTLNGRPTQDRFPLCVSATSDSQGVARIKGIDAGTYRLFVACEGMGPTVDEVRVTRQTGTSRHTVPLPRSCRVDGQVLTADGRPLAGALVDLETPLVRREQADREHVFGSVGRIVDLPVGRNPFALFAETDALGRFWFYDLAPAAELAVRATAADGQSGQVTGLRLMPADPIEELPVRLHGQIRIEGEVRTADGSPLPRWIEAGVAGQPRGQFLATERNASSASFVLSAEQTDRIEVAVSAPGFALETRVLESLGAAGSLRVEFALERGNILNVHVLGPDGRPLRQIAVSAYLAVGGEEQRKASFFRARPLGGATDRAWVIRSATDDAGWARFTGLPDAPLLVTTEADAYEPWLRDQVLPVTDELTANLVQRAPRAEPEFGRVEGRVASAATGQPITGFRARLLVLDAAGELASIREAQVLDDRYIFEKAPVDRSSRVLVEAQGYAPGSSEESFVRSKLTTSVPLISLADGVGGRIMLTSPRSRPLGGLPVSMVPLAPLCYREGTPPAVAHGVTNGRGVAVFEHLAPGRYRVEIESSLLDVPVHPLVEVGDDPLDATLQCVPGGGVTFVLMSVGAIQVPFEVRQENGDVVHRHVFSRHDDTLQLTLAPGKYTGCTLRYGLGPAESEFEVRAGERQSFLVRAFAK